MESQVIQVFEGLGLYAILLSIVLNIIISVLGVVPSFFLTAANISFFGFGQGLLISIAGEAFGAIVSFYLYRKGIKKVTGKVTVQSRWINNLKQTEGITAFFLVLALRLAPFVPSGIITLVSAGSKMGILNFSAASTLGKIPALLIEAYSVKAVLQFDWQGKMILGLLSIFIIVFVYMKKRKHSIK